MLLVDQLVSRQRKELDVLVVGNEALEELRMLSNFQVGGRALIQIFLLGQPEFRDKLASPGLEQLRQRVIAALGWPKVLGVRQAVRPQIVSHRCWSVQIQRMLGCVMVLVLRSVGGAI